MLKKSKLISVGSNGGRQGSSHIAKNYWRGWKSSENLRQYISYDRAIPLLGIYFPRSALAGTQSGLYENAHCNIAKERNWKSSKCLSIGEWIKCKICKSWNTIH